MQSTLNRVPPDTEHVSVLSGQYITVNAAAGLMGVSFRTVRRWARKNHIPIRMIGNVCVIATSAIERETAQVVKIQYDDTN